MTTYIQADNYEVTRLDDEFIILNMDHFTITKLNNLGGMCWSLLSEIQTVESLMYAVQEQYPYSVEHLENDIQLFLSDLLQCGLIQQDHE